MSLTCMTYVPVEFLSNNLLQHNYHHVRPGLDHVVCSQLECAGLGALHLCICWLEINHEQGVC